jgi:5'-nucleotidase
MKRVLMLTNDDGFDARGLSVLEQVLTHLGDVFVVAPMVEQSGSSHSLTLGKHIVTEKIDDRHYKVDGTPTDCVLLGLQGLLKTKPDLLISGINHGPNMGEDVTYSGTVAAAIEGMILGIPSLAISSLQRNLEDGDEISRVARVIVEAALQRGLPDGSLLNVNIPNPSISPIRGVKITKLGSRAYENLLTEEKSEGSKRSYMIRGKDPIWKDDDGTDIVAVHMGYVSVTPLHIDLTDYRTIVDMETWRFPL